VPFNLGVPELLIILAIMVLLFGASRIADIGGALGRGIRNFRREVGGEEEVAGKHRLPKEEAGDQKTPYAATGDRRDEINRCIQH
jgi:sec-independent protein translocase protein TatA